MPWKGPAQVSASVATPALLPMTLRAIRSTRRVISAAARRENVINKIRRGSAPLTMTWATRCASVFVFPGPAPAMTRNGRPGQAVSMLHAMFHCATLSRIEASVHRLWTSVVSSKLDRSRAGPVGVQTADLVKRICVPVGIEVWLALFPFKRCLRRLRNRTCGHACARCRRGLRHWRL